LEKDAPFSTAFVGYWLLIIRYWLFFVEISNKKREQLGIDDDLLVLAGDNVVDFSFGGFVEFAPPALLDIP